MLSVALANKPNIADECTKEELARLSFIGDSAIGLFSVMHMFLFHNRMLNEKEMDSLKVRVIKTENIKDVAKLSGLDLLLLRDREDEEIRDIGEVYQGFAGFTSLYLGLDASMMFIYDTRLLRMASEQWRSYENVGAKTKLLQNYS